MKKFAIILLALVMCLGIFAACGESKEPAKEENTELTVTVNTGSKETKTICQKGDVIEEPKAPNRAGYIFEGWYIGEEKVEFPYTVTKSVTIEAKLTAEPAEPVVLSDQPEDVELAIGDRKGPMVIPTEVRGYKYTYQWYKNTTDSNEGGTAIEGATDSTCVLPTTEYKAGDVFYIYCEVTGTRSSNGAVAKVNSDTAKVTITAGKKNILFVGSAFLTWTSVKADTPSYVEAMLNATAKDEYVVDRLIKNGSTYCVFESGFTGVDQSEVKALTDAKSYDYVVIQLSRDYVLSYDTTREKELKAVENITNYAKTANPNCKIILYAPNWRANPDTDKFKAAYGEAGITTVEAAQEALRDYYDNIILSANPDALVCDMYKGFEKMIAAEIHPFATGSVGQDYPNADASYLAACVIFNQITGKTSEGLEVYSTGTSAVDPTVAAKLQKMATELLAK